MALRCPLKWVKKGAAEPPGQGPASSEEGPLYPPQMVPGPEVTFILQLLKGFQILSLPQFLQQPGEVGFFHPTDKEGPKRGPNCLKPEIREAAQKSPAC